MTDKFRIRQDAQGNPVYEYGNQIVSKEVFDQKNAQSIAEQKEMQKPDLFDSQFDDMRAKALAVKKPLKQAKGGSINLKDCKVSTHQKNSKHSGW